LIFQEEAIALSREQDTKTDELNSEKEAGKPVENMLHREHETPLFLRDSSEGKKGNAQDEKDKVEE
jgi:hypothetical protein